LLRPGFLHAAGAPARARHGSELKLGEILVRRGAVSAGEVESALAEQRRSGLRLGELLVARRAVTQEAVEAALARQWSIGRIDIRDSSPDPHLLERCDEGRCLALGCIPWRRIGTTIVIAIADPAGMGEAPAACGIAAGNAAFALAPRQDIEAALAAGFGRRLTARAETRTPAPLSCRSWARHSTRAGALVGLGLFAAGMSLGWSALLAALFSWIILWNLMTALLRGAALILSFRKPAPPPPDDLPRLRDFRRLPRVSVLVPLYRETEVLDGLIAALSRIDYPSELLEFVLVLEAHDFEMREALAARSLPAGFRVLQVPGERLRTKPRAMNYALDFVRGDIVGIYDAEDQPDPGQIRAVVECFADGPPRLACVQARIGYYNARQNWLSRCFAIEYATWFEVILPGIQRLGLPIPLGGTSVFFRRAALEEVGAWDAHNVTEDADLGMRLARFGFATRVIDSTTLEEANCRTGAWIRQRSRWLKGYAATWITHMRRPLRLWRDLGPAGFLGFQVILLGGLTAYLALPLLWIGWAASALWGLPPWLALLPGDLLTGFWTSLLAGQAVMLLTCLRALSLTRQWRLAPVVLSLPLYWPLGAMAAYRAVMELVVAPFRWHKTRHGLAERYRPGQPAALPSQTGGGAIAAAE